MTARGTLMNHCGATLVTKGDLEIIPAPPPTETWYPVRHLDVLDSVEETLGNAGFEIQKYQLSISHGKQRFFGVLDIASPLAEGVSLSIGLRNSNDKTFPIGFCVGNRTFVCDNLAFSAEIVISKRHTRFGSDRFREGIAAAVRELQDYRTLEAQRIERLQAMGLPDQAAESLMLRAWEQGLLGTRLLRRSWMSGVTRRTKISRTERRGRCCRPSHISRKIGSNATRTKQPGKSCSFRHS